MSNLTQEQRERGLIAARKKGRLNLKEMTNKARESALEMLSIVEGIARDERVLPGIRLRACQEIISRAYGQASTSVATEQALVQQTVTDEDLRTMSEKMLLGMLKQQQGEVIDITPATPPTHHTDQPISDAIITNDDENNLNE